ncbi:flagellar brake domain-containing protein [Clostridium carnis]
MKLNIRVNNKVAILWDEEIYKSVIQDINEKESLISIPVCNGIYLTMRDGDEVDQVYYDDKGNVFNYKCKVLGRVIENNIPFYKLGKPYDIRKIQRRDYVRVNVVQVINYIKEESLIRDFQKEEKFNPALLLDLSGGGMKIKIKEDISYGDSIVGNLIYQNEKIIIRGKIVRKEKTEDNRYICGIKFCDIDNGTREKIIKTVFTIMRKQRELS